jgi:phosphoribosyl-AMP cyclohydrolase
MDEKLALKFDDKGLITAVVVDDATGEVLMVAWMNDEAVKQTLSTRKATFYSRSRRKMWVKGEESGHVQEVKSVRVDCDQDTLVVRVTQKGGACHEGYRSCFYREITPAGGLRVIAERLFDPKAVYKK